MGIAWRRLNYAMNDFITIPLLALPMAAGTLFILVVIALVDNCSFLTLISVMIAVAAVCAHP